MLRWVSRRLCSLVLVLGAFDVVVCLFDAVPNVMLSNGGPNGARDGDSVAIDISMCFTIWRKSRLVTKTLLHDEVLSVLLRTSQEVS